MGRPRVTVLLPVRNGERFLGEALDSVLSQTYRDLEVLVVNDHSTDATVDILADYRDPRLRVCDNAGTPGFVESLNFGLRVARGEFIARMDADDISLPTRLERQVAFLDANPRVGILGTNYEPIDQRGMAVGRPARRLPTSPGHVGWRLLSYNCICHPTVMMRTAVLEKVGGYDGNTFPAEDYDLWLRADRVTRIANLPEVLLRYRQHEKNVTSTRRREAAAQELEAARRGQARLLGRSVSLAAVQISRKPAMLREGAVDRVDALQAAANVRDLADSCLTEVGLSSQERSAIASAAAWRLIRLSGATLPRKPVLAGALAKSTFPALLRFLGICVSGAILVR